MKHCHKRIHELTNPGTYKDIEQAILLFNAAIIIIRSSNGLTPMPLITREAKKERAIRRNALALEKLNQRGGKSPRPEPKTSIIPRERTITRCVACKSSRVYATVTLYRNATLVGLCNECVIVHDEIVKSGGSMAELFRQGKERRKLRKADVKSDLALLSQI